MYIYQVEEEDSGFTRRSSIHLICQLLARNPSHPLYLASLPTFIIYYYFHADFYFHSFLFGDFYFQFFWLSVQLIFELPAKNPSHLPFILYWLLLLILVLLLLLNCYCYLELKWVVENSWCVVKVVVETVVLTNFTALTPLLTLLATFVFADQCQACDKQMKNQQI